MAEENNRDGIVNKIKKLLALSKGTSNDNEAMAAALKAQRLIASYDVEEYEYREAGFRVPKIDEVTCEVNTIREWRHVLASIVAENFRCRCFSNNKRIYDECGWATKRKTYHKVFFGYEHDAQAAALIFGYLYSFADRKANRLVKRYKNKAPYYNRYVLGFCAGVKSELEKQSYALMIVTPGAVKDAFEEYSRIHLTDGKELSLSTKGCNAVASLRLHEQGIRDGRDAICARRINKPDNDFLLRDGVK